MIFFFKKLFFQNLTNLQIVLKNIFWLAVGQIGSRFIKAFFVIYAARVLGASNYGVFSYGLALTGFFLIFSDVGLGGLLTREIAKKPEQRKEYLSTILWIKIALLLITAILILLIAPYFAKIEGTTILLPIITLMIIFDGLRDTLVSFFRGQEKMEFEAITALSVNIALIIFGFGILYFWKTPYALSVIYTISSGLGCFISLFFLKHYISGIFSHFERRLLRPLILAAWPMAFSGFAATFLFNIDVIMLGWWRSAEEIGFYSVAQKITGMLCLIPVLIATSIFPTLSRFVSQKDPQNVSLFITKIVKIIILISVPIIIGGIILAAPIINLIFGPAYLHSANIFKILIGSILGTGLLTIFTYVVYAYNKQARVAGYVIIAALSNIVLNALFIPLFGTLGAATATITATFINICLAWKFSKKINNFYTLKHLKKIIIAAIVMGIFTIIFNNLGVNVIANIITSAGIYIGILYILKESVVKEEIKTIILFLKQKMTH